MLAQTVNFINVLGWGAVIFLVASKFLINPTLFFTQDLSLQIRLVKYIQAFQVLDIVLILAGKSKGSLFGSIAQITGRLIVAQIFLQYGSDHYKFAHMAICWAIADMIRYLYYLVKNLLMAVLRYNMFIFLYPLGVWGEMRIANDYIKRNASTLSISQIQIIRVVQGIILFGTFCLYLHMFRMRSKHFANLKFENGKLVKPESQNKKKQ